jgi:hypothetical protein
MQAENAKSSGSSEARIRNNMHNTLTVKFLDLVTSYQEAQRKYKDKHNEKVRRQIKIVNPDATEEMIQQAIESGSKDIFASQLVDNRYKKEAEEALKYVQSKHKEIQKLESSSTSSTSSLSTWPFSSRRRANLSIRSRRTSSPPPTTRAKASSSSSRPTNIRRRAARKCVAFSFASFIVAAGILAPIILASLGQI